MVSLDEARKELARRELARRRAGSEPSVIGDVLKSSASGAARGVADLAGLPGTIGGAMESGLDWVKAKGYELATGEKPEPGSFFAQEPLPNPLSGSALREDLSSATGGATDYQPQTTAGKYARTIGEFAPGAVAFGGANIPNMLRSGVAPAIASEGAGHATEGTALEPWARIAGALVGGAAGAKTGRSSQPALPTAAEIKNSAGYSSLKEPMKNARLTGDAYKQIVKTVWDEAQDFGLTTQLKSEFGGTLRDFLKRAETSGGASLHDLELLRRSLRNAAGNKLDDASQALSGRLVDKLDDAVDELSEASIAAGAESGRPVIDALKDARETYRVGKKADVIETAISKAQNQASGVENGLRIQFRQIADNPKKMRGFTKAEQDAIRQVATGNFSANALRWLGSFGVPIDQGRNFLGSLSGGGVGATVGGILGGPVGATIGGFALPAAGTAAKLGAQKATEGNARLAEALVKAGPRRSDEIASQLAGRQAAGREALVRALLQSQSAAQVPGPREYAR